MQAELTRCWHVSRRELQGGAGAPWACGRVGGVVSAEIAAGMGSDALARWKISTMLALARTSTTSCRSI
jgi:hypothetical protein